jgi:hypothetical protein
MRVALIYVPTKAPGSLADYAKAMARALESAGHFVDLTEARPDETPRVTGHDYVIVGTESASPLGKISSRVSNTLAQCGMVVGKRSMAFIRKSGLRPERTLARLMKAMEAEGMIVNCAEVIASVAGAEAAARGAPIERK